MAGERGEEATGGRARSRDPDSAVYTVPVELEVVLGSTRMRIGELLRLGRGAVIPLDRKRHEPVELFVAGRRVARGRVVVIDDRLGVSVTEIAPPRRAR